MQLVFHRYFSDPHRASPRRRAAALVLALAVHALIIMMLLRQAPSVTRKVESVLRTFQLSPDRAEEPAKTKAAAKSKPRTSPAKQAPAPPKAPVVPPVTAPVAPPMIVLSKEEFASADISKLPPRSESAQGEAGNGQDSKSVYGPGEGPGGRQLFEAEWYRRPTDAELAGYMPPNAPRSGWGLVACRTIEHYQVDNCQTLGESPLGSGLARAVRLAAWQFRVLPPRIDGKPVIGAWVRIRIDYTQGVAGSDR